LEKIPLPIGDVVFKCRCTYTIAGEPKDTLFYEEIPATSFNAKYNVFIENSPYDTAANRVRKECPKCKLDFMTQIRVGEVQSTIYTCFCGHVVAAV
jgi:hypothetical protein